MGNIIKYSIVIFHIFLGLLIIFLNVNNLLHLSTLTTRSSDQQYYYGISLFAGLIYAILGTVLGLCSIIGAVAFRKDKRWAKLVLPLVLLIVGVWMIIDTILYPAEGFSAVGDVIQIILGIVLLLFLVGEISYLVLRKPTQAD